MFTGYQVLVIGLGAFFVGMALGIGLLLKIKVLEWKDANGDSR